MATYQVQFKRDEAARLRFLAGMSQRQAAIKLNVSPTHLGYIERGTREPSPSLLKRMAELYGVPMTALFTEITGDAA